MLLPDRIPAPSYLPCNISGADVEKREVSPSIDSHTVESTRRPHSAVLLVPTLFASRALPNPCLKSTHPHLVNLSHYDQTLDVKVLMKVLVMAWQY